MDKINERIRYLRKDILKLTQEQFSNSIKISRSNLGSIEIGRISVTDRVISDICEGYHVNEVWLRTGEGGDDNMFTKIDPDDRFSINLGKLSVTENKLAQNMINAIAEADPEKLAYIEEFMKKCLGL